MYHFPSFARFLNLSGKSGSMNWRMVKLRRHWEKKSVAIIVRKFKNNWRDKVFPFMPFPVYIGHLKRDLSGSTNQSA